MKIIIILMLMGMAGGTGYYLKSRLKKEYNFLCYAQEFARYYNANISLFKNEVVLVVESFINSKSKKNASFAQIFKNENNIYKCDLALINEYVKNSSDASMICEYLNNIGKSEYEFEKDKNLQFEKFISECKEKSLSNLETKGNLYFKLALLFGAVLSIIIW